jgi:hypothetical protein
LFGKVSLALNLTFSPGEKEQRSHVTIFREPSGQSRRGYFQRRGEHEKKSSNVALADSIFPPRLQKMLWTGQTNAFKPISAIRINLNREPNGGSLNW